MSTSLNKHLILIGGGHSHALVLKLWGEKPLPGIRLTLISAQTQTPYSGMLPGLVAGHYSFNETHIDLDKLCRSTGAHFIQATVTGLDLDRRQVHFADNEPLSFDLLSINAGITPDLTVPGADTFSIPVKPIARFYPHWQKLLTQLQQCEKEQSIGVVGGGAAGAELVMAMQHALKQTPLGHSGKVTFYLVQRNQGLPEGYPARLQQKMAALFAQKQIQVIDGFNVKEVLQNQLISDEGRRLPLDHIFWCTNARAAHWPKTSGLTTDNLGFIETNDYLQSISHGFVFAAGDIAQQRNYPRARAGVFAVRQGPVLFENLQRCLLQEPLKPFVPQRHFLSLLACGEAYAIGCRLGSRLPSVAGRWVWHWKDRIDRRFMGLFE